MEDSKQLRSFELGETTPISLPLYQRRPIRSNTYLKLVQLFSLCTTDSSQFSGDHVVDLRAGRSEDDPVNSDQMTTTSSITEENLVQGTSTGMSEESVVFRDVAFNEPVVVSEQDGVNLVTDVDAQANCFSVGDFLGEEKQSDDSAVQLVDEQDNLENVLELCKCNSGPTEQIVEKEFHIDDFCDVLNSFFDRDMVDSSKLEDDIKGSNCLLEQTGPNEFEHSRKLKEMELRKLVSTIDTVPSCPVIGDGDVEEGEICGEVGDFNGLMDTIYKETSSPDEITSRVVDASQNSGDNKESICIGEHIEMQIHGSRGHSMIGIPDDDSACIKVQHRSLPTQLRLLEPQSYRADRHLETQDCDGSEKKRKRGPLTKEKRSKKKLKSRIKRAEKNRKLGIKRLKLQPVLKPKVVTYCRHFLQGRCYEGENCKFSHDTTPLTKSKPCGHFARHSCMKGDDCPFDHQLFKYPCNNYATTGFCSRGAECLFSHETQITSSSDVLDSDIKPDQLVRPGEKGHTKVSKAIDAEVLFPSQLNKSYSSKTTDSLISLKQVEAKSSNVKDSSVKSILKNVAKPFSKNAVQAPKGVSFLSAPKISRVCSDNLEVGEGCKKVGDDAVAQNETILKVPGSNIETSQLSKEVASRKPRGINFLSFVQPSQDDSSCKTFHNLFSTSYKETGKFGKTDISEMKQTGSVVPRSDGSSLTNLKTIQAGTSLVLNSSQVGENTTMSIPTQSTNAMPLDRIQADKIVFKDVTFLSADTEKATSPCKHPLKTSQHSVGSWAQPSSTITDRHMSSAFKAMLLSSAPSLVQKAVHSTLSFAANFEPKIKPSSSFMNRED